MMVRKKRDEDKLNSLYLPSFILLGVLIVMGVILFALQSLFAREKPLFPSLQEAQQAMDRWFPFFQIGENYVEKTYVRYEPKGKERYTKEGTNSITVQYRLTDGIVYEIRFPVEDLEFENKNDVFLQHYIGGETFICSGKNPIPRNSPFSIRHDCIRCV